MSLTELLFWVVYVGGVIGALFRPICGVLLYLLVYNLNPETQWWGSHVESLHLRTSFTVAVATGIGMVLSWRKIQPPATQFPWMFRLAIVFLLYCALVSLSGGDSLFTERSQLFLEKLFKVLVFVFLMIRIVRTTQHLQWVMWIWIIGTIYIGYQAWSGVGDTYHGRLNVGLGGPDFAESSGLATHLVAMLALAGYFFLCCDSLRAKAIALLAGGFAANTIIMTRTRNALPGIIAMIAFALVRLPRGLRVKSLIAITVGIVAASSLTDSGWWTRMNSMKNTQSDLSIARRFDSWHAAMIMAQQYPFGVGLGNFPLRIQEYVSYPAQGRSAHSTYFECLAELGYPGLFLFLSVICATFWHYEDARQIGKYWVFFQNRDESLSRELRKILLIATANELAISGFLVCSLFHTRLWTEEVWLLLATSCCVHNVAQGLRSRVYAAEMQMQSGSDVVPALQPIGIQPA